MPVFTNGLGIKTSGIPAYDSTTGIFTQSSLTQYNLLLGGASNAIVSLTNGAAGTYLQSNGTSANPSWVAIPSGGIVGAARASKSTGDSYTGNITPSTTPTTSNTKKYMSVTYAATSTSNILTFQFSCSCCLATGIQADSVGFFLFNGTTLLYSQCSGTDATGQMMGIGLNFYMNPASTASTTYDIYYVCATNHSNTVYINQDSSGNNFGGSMLATLQVTEVKP